MSSVDWSLVFDVYDPNAMAGKFYNVFEPFVECCVPKRVCKDSSNEPWLNRELRNLRNRRNRAYKRYKSNPNVANREAYDVLYLEFELKSVEAYDSYAKSMGEKIIYDHSNFFKFVNVKRKCHGYPSTMHFEGETSSDVKGICDMFAKSLGGAYRHAQSSNVNLDPGVSHSPLLDVHLSIEDIFMGIVYLDPSKGPGPDGLPPSLLINCASEFLLPLTIMYNCSLRTGIFPELWKRSYLVPVFKNGARNNVKNYRGIAIISAIPKLFEKLVLEKIELIVLSRLNDEQHGFVKIWWFILPS